MQFRLHPLRFIFLSATWFLCLLSAAHARYITEQQVEVTEDGTYQIEIKFLFPVRYQSHSPDSPSDQVRIQLYPVNFQQLTDDQVQDLREHIPLSWDITTGIPLKEMTVEGGDPEQPQLLLVFDQEMEFEVRSSANLLSLIITLKQPEGLMTVNRVPPEVPAPDYENALDSRVANLMNGANARMKNQNFDQAVRLYRQALQTARGVDRENMMEYYGYALQQARQHEKSRDQYLAFLQDYPYSVHAERVQQRLERISWMIDTGFEPPPEEEKPQRWAVNNYGVLSYFYFRDQTTPERGDTTVNLSDLVTNVDLYSKASNKSYDIRSQFSWSNTNRLLPDQEDINAIDTLNVEVSHLPSDDALKLGRQFKGTEGLLDIFDGAYLSCKLTDQIKINTFAGYPVDDTANKTPDTDRAFTGTSLNLGTFRDKLDLVTFFVHQTNQGKTDREAIGGEASYNESNKALYSSVDYDVFFNDLNVLFTNGWWTLPTNTTLGFSYDYRNNPSLTLNNALIGQNLKELSDLLKLYSYSDLQRIARDRTAVSKSLSFNATQRLKEDLQMTGNLTVYEWEGTVPSAGVEGELGTGRDYFYSLQWIKNHLLKKQDAFISDLSFADAPAYYGYTVKFTLQYPSAPKLRFIPELRLDYRDQKANDDHRFLTRPGLQVDYRLKKQARLEMETALERAAASTSGRSTSQDNWFLRVGFVVSF